MYVIVWLSYNGHMNEPVIKQEIHLYIVKYSLFLYRLINGIITVCVMILFNTT